MSNTQNNRGHGIQRTQTLNSKHSNALLPCKHLPHQLVKQIDLPAQCLTFHDAQFQLLKPIIALLGSVMLDKGFHTSPAGHSVISSAGQTCGHPNH